MTHLADGQIWAHYPGGNDGFNVPITPSAPRRTASISNSSFWAFLVGASFVGLVVLYHIATFICAVIVTCIIHQQVGLWHSTFYGLEVLFAFIATWSAIGLLVLFCGGTSSGIHLTPLIVNIFVAVATIMCTVNLQKGLAEAGCLGSTANGTMHETSRMEPRFLKEQAFRDWAEADTSHCHTGKLLFGLFCALDVMLTLPLLIGLVLIAIILVASCMVV